MAGTKRLAQLAKKIKIQDCCSPVPAKGHCVMYTADGRRFKVSFKYLGTTIFGELLRMSREEFGFASDGKITLPCDAAVMEYAMCLQRTNASAEVECIAEFYGDILPLHLLYDAYCWSQAADLLSVASEEHAFIRFL